MADAVYILIGLLYVTGLRSGEALRVDVKDLDSSGLVLSVRGKLDRQRLVPVHPSTAAELRGYCDGRTSGPLLVGRTGQRLARTAADAGFRRVVATCGLAPQQGAGPPRLHAFRHTLAVDALVDAHRRGLESTPASRFCPPSWATRTPRRDRKPSLVDTWSERSLVECRP